MQDYATPNPLPNLDSLMSRLAQKEEEKADKQEERMVLKAHIKTQCTDLMERRNRLTELLEVYQDIASTL